MLPNWMRKEDVELLFQEIESVYPIMEDIFPSIDDWLEQREAM